ncbi:MAG: thioredoxin family protein [Clostridiales bacterium]|nr:MAG: thioredoxin family protein [Clostridiales bacterium]
MKLFGLFEKKKEEKEENREERKDNISNEAKSNLEKILILGSGCDKCIELEKITKIAISDLGLDLKVQHIEDFKEIMTYGVMATPGLVINNKVVSSGRKLSLEEVKKFLEEAYKK